MFGRCFFVGMAISSVAAFGQGNSDQPQYISHAEITRAGTSVTIHASSPRPVEQALSGIRREYGLILDYEEGPVRDSSNLAAAGNRQILKGADIKVTMAGPKDSTPAEEAAFLQSALAELHAAGGSRQFTLLQGANNRLTVTPSDAPLRVLDTKILIDPRPRSIDATIEEIFRALNNESGIVIERGGLVDNELSNTIVTVGSTSTPIAARDLLSQALNGTLYAKFWILTWDPNTDRYAMNLQTAVKVDDTLIGVGRETPILTKPSR